MGASFPGALTGFHDHEVNVGFLAHLDKMDHIPDPGATRCGFHVKLGWHHLSSGEWRERFRAGGIHIPYIFPIYSLLCIYSPHIPYIFRIQWGLRVSRLYNSIDIAHLALQ